MSTPSAFISYSRADREFVRILDASLRVAGVETLRDEHGIAVGENIPEWIYDSISSATHLIYVVSASSVSSKWVREELSVAKMREKEDAGFRVLPLIIDEIELPISVRHIRYADYRNWADPARYRAATLELLRGLGLEAKLVDHSEVVWWIENQVTVRGAMKELTMGFATIGVGVGWVQWFEQYGLKWVGRVLYDEDEGATFEGALGAIRRLVEPASQVSARLEVLARMSHELSEWRFPWNETLAKEHEKLRLYYHELGAFLAILEELETEALQTITAAIGSTKNDT
jgi:hypothetical protein